jgi:hypothetical protein
MAHQNWNVKIANQSKINFIKTVLNIRNKSHGRSPKISLVITKLSTFSEFEKSKSIIPNVL